MNYQIIYKKEIHDKQPTVKNHIKVSLQDYTEKFWKSMIQLY